MEHLWSTDKGGAREYITSTPNGKFAWKKRPVVKEDSWYPGDQSITQAKVEAYDRARKAADPTYVPPSAPPPPKEATPAPRRAEAKAPMFPEVNVNKPPTTAPFGSPTTIDVKSGVQARATDFLRKIGKPVTPANIEHAIKTGRVK